MRVADFFCGGGGFSEGFRQAGFDIVFAVVGHLEYRDSTDARTISSGV